MYIPFTYILLITVLYRQCVCVYNMQMISMLTLYHSTPNTRAYE